MSPLEETFKTACKERTVLGVVVAATDKSGTFNYSKAFGVRSRDSDDPLQTDDVLWLASCTKLLTTIAALQCVERGHVKLDDPVSSILPEVAALQVLKGFNEDGSPILNNTTKPITLRHLLTHSNGLVYEMFGDPNVQRYRAYRKEPPAYSGGVIERFSSVPLTFDVGTGWMYGPGIDWAGKLVERISGQTLEDYMKENIWEPLGIKDTTFFPKSRPDLEKRRFQVSRRDETTGSWEEPQNFVPDEPECFGGHGLFGTLPEFLKVLHSLLVDDGKLLRPEMTAQMFTPQLNTAGSRALQAIREGPFTFWLGEYPEHVGLDWGLGGMLTMDDSEGWRRKHTLIWCGLANLFWFIDRKAGLCGIFGTQIQPYQDAKSQSLITVFEKAMYARV